MKDIKPSHLLIIICCCLYIAACTGTANAQGAFIIPLAQQTNSLRGTVSLASTVYGIISGLCATWLIRALKKYPLKYILLSTCLLEGVITASFGYMHDVRIYLAVNILKGFLNTVFNSTIVIIIIGNWFISARSTVTAIILGFSGIAGALFSPLFSSVVASAGLAAGYRLQAALQIILALPAAFLVTLTPQEKGLQPHVSEIEGSGKTEEDTGRHLPFRKSDPTFWQLCCLSVLTAVMFQLSNHFNGYAQTINMAQTGPLMVSAIMIGNIFFKFVCGIVCDRYGNRFGVPFLCVCGLAGCVMLLLGGSSKIMLLAGAFILGAVYANQVTTSALIREVYGSSQYAEVFAAQSVYYGLMYFGNMMFGYIYDFTSSYRPCFAAGIMFMLISLLLNHLILRKSDNYKAQ